jgi:hypothetical protein
VQEYELPSAISFNYEELKAEVEKKMNDYATCVYTDDTIKLAKADRAELNKLKKSINDKRLELERAYNKPFAEFKAKVNEIISIIDKPVEIIDRRVKEYEAEQKEKRRTEIQEIIATMENSDLITSAWDDRWLNASVTIKKIKEEIIEMDSRFTRDLNVLREFSEYSFEAIEKYKLTLDLTAAIEETKRLSEQARRKAEFEAQRAKIEAEEAAERERLSNAPIVPKVERPVEPVADTEEGFIPLFDVEPTEELTLRFYITPADKRRLLNLLNTNRFIYDEL